MEQIGYIYKLTAPNGKVYIGQTVNLDQRMSSYVKGGSKSQKRLHRSINKYGWDSFTKDIIFQGECSGKCLDRLEILFIHQYGSYSDGLNMTKGGDKPPSQKGKKLSPEQIARRSIVRRGKKLGPITSEHRAKLSAAHRGKKLSPEHRAKISTALRGKTRSEEFKQKIRKPKSPEVAAKRCKPVSQFTKDGVWVRDWDSIKEAGETLNINKSNIAGCVKGRFMSVGGFVWKYKS